MLHRICQYACLLSSSEPWEVMHKTVVFHHHDPLVEMLGTVLMLLKGGKRGYAQMFYSAYS